MENCFKTLCTISGCSPRKISGRISLLVRLQRPFPVTQILRPGFSFCSRTVTVAPFCAATIAAVSPDAPPPTTITCGFSFIPSPFPCQGSVTIFASTSFCKDIMTPSFACSQVSPPWKYTAYGSFTGPSAESSIEDPCTNAPAAIMTWLS